MSNVDALRDMQRSWQPPPELGARPRPVQFTALGLVLAGLAVLLATAGIVAGTLLWGQARESGRREALLDHSGQSAGGRIERLWRHAEGKTTACRIAYSYTAAGQVYTRQESLRCGDWKTLWQGERVTVEFAPSEPAISRLARFRQTGQVPFFAGPLVAVALMAVAAVLGRMVFRERRLLEDGRPAPGVVTRIGPRTDKGRSVYYEFALLSGARAKGHFGPVHGKAVPAVGAPVVVLYEADNPKRNGRYPTAFFKLRK
jgi:hypothetical protein